VLVAERLKPLPFKTVLVPIQTTTTAAPFQNCFSADPNYNYCRSLSKLFSADPNDNY
jgi:hypothetical protein